ncbi:hypothetical protein ACFOOK_28305 [Micromonospora krabiensis]|uniref:Uncharacterized protein n=1 Tax=Micromonospora krabiensis TaxID=307121 RepID=A0A1C3N4M2_9ACTN|nr:hypothetical protein [Micromonospora krabiensis]SBV27527.1 hypothetical protein GA0070620_3051 [Micromonospora krabiensis]
MTATDSGDRQLLVAIRRWARDNGWHWFECWGWVNADSIQAATLAVEWDQDARTITIAHGDDGVFVPTRLSAGSVGQAVQRLVALDILPATFGGAR